MIYNRNKPRRPPEALSDFKESTFSNNLEDIESISRAMLAGDDPPARLSRGNYLSIYTQYSPEWVGPTGKQRAANESQAKQRTRERRREIILTR